MTEIRQAVVLGDEGRWRGTLADDLAKSGLEVLRCTGTLHELSERLDQRFLLCRSSVYVRVDWCRFVAAATRNGGLATVLLPPRGRRDVRMDEQGVLASPAVLDDASIAVLSREVLHKTPTDRPCDILADVLPPLVDTRQPVFGYLTSEYVRQIRSREDECQVETDIDSGKALRRADLVILDRDGVLVEDVDLLCDPEKLVLVPKAAEGLRQLNEAGIFTALATNQSVVARGICDEARLANVHERMAELLAAERAHLDSVHCCPHHPDTHYPEGVPALRGPCRCRKPSTGMVEDALAHHDVPRSRTVVIGDRTGDMQMAHNAGLPAIGLDTGNAVGDGAYPARPTWRFANLAESCAWLVR